MCVCVCERERERERESARERERERRERGRVRGPVPPEAAAEHSALLALHPHHCPRVCVRACVCV